jgi:hypothetical protein
VRGVEGEDEQSKFRYDKRGGLMSEDKINCFVIMPFSKTKNHTEEYWTNHFNNFLKPLIEETPNLLAHRSEPLRGDILKLIITDLIVSPIVIADLTDKNANVFWELGVRQSFKHGTITIAEEGTDLPFDVFAQATLKYNTKNPLKIASFKEQFNKAIQDCLLHPDRPDSHVIETLSGRGTLFEIFQRDESIRRLNAVLLECETNLKVLESLINTYEENKKRSKTIRRRLSIFSFNSRRGTIPARLSSIAVELLVTHRYLDETIEFYEFAEAYHGFIQAINAQLNDWVVSPEGTEEWILFNEKMILSSVNNFKDTVELSRNKVSKLL